MKFENEYWVLTKEDAINYAKTLVINSECENLLNDNKPVYTYEHCLLHAKKQLKRNINLTQKERKLLHLKKMILKAEHRFYNDEMIKSVFKTLDNWYSHLGKIRLNKIFKEENRQHLEKVKSFSK